MVMVVSLSLVCITATIAPNEVLYTISADLVPLRFRIGSDKTSLICFNNLSVYGVHGTGVADALPRMRMFVYEEPMTRTASERNSFIDLSPFSKTGELHGERDVYDRRNL
jgi:hypothetical protein